MAGDDAGIKGETTVEPLPPTDETAETAAVTAAAPVIGDVPGGEEPVCCPEYAEYGA